MSLLLARAGRLYKCFCSFSSCDSLLPKIHLCRVMILSNITPHGRELLNNNTVHHRDAILYSLCPERSASFSGLYPYLLRGMDPEGDPGTIGKLLLSSIQRCMTHTKQVRYSKIIGHLRGQKMSRNFQTTRYSFNIRS